MGDKKKFVPEDLYRFKFVSDPQMSPDGEEILYVLSEVSEDHTKYVSHLRLYNCTSGCDRRFSYGGSDSKPRWSPDGSMIAFGSDRKGKRQLYVMPRRGGEARPLVEFKYGIGEAVWSPDGSMIAFTASCFADDTVNELMNLEENPEQKKAEKICKVIDTLKYRANGTGLLNGRKQHIFVVAANGGKPRKLTMGAYHHSTPVWSPDGKHLVFSSNRSEEPDYQVHIADLWMIPVSGGEPKRLTNGDGRFHSPAFSPDGRLLAYLGHHNQYGSATLTRLYLLDLVSGERRCLTEELDFSIGSGATADMTLGGSAGGPVFSSDGKYIFIHHAAFGEVHLYRVNLESGTIDKLTNGTIQVKGFTVSRDNSRAALVYSDASQPGDIAVLDLQNGKQRRCTSVNETLLAQRYTALPEEIRFKGADGWEIQGWIIKPIGFQADKKYPMILEVHGGPHGMYAPNFFFEFQLLAASGYVVLFTNPRGSQGYGQRFVDAVRGDYGGNDYADLMAAVDYASQLPYVDEERLGVTGGSYGGFMTNWIVSHTDRFKAAVTQRSISNWISFYGVSDIGYHFTEMEHGANPWDDLQKLLKHSPLTYVKNITTPLLIIHGDEDWRCPIEQAEQLYVCLKRLKREVQLVRFPGANHELSRSGHPQQRVERLTRIVDWFNNHIERYPHDYAIRLDIQ